jgi:peptide-methionine (S)-S-oxide reductase
MTTEIATFAAGCFWGVQHLFDALEGVLSTRVGYIGGHVSEPEYRQVCTGNTGHAEAVEVVFDSAIIGFEQLLSVFWRCHDPTTLNRQGPDVGTQYRSAVFYHSVVQQQQLQASLTQHQPAFKAPIVTTVEPATTFWPAEEYHQHYFKKKGIAPSCHNLSF